MSYPGHVPEALQRGLAGVAGGGGEDQDILLHTPFRAFAAVSSWGSMESATSLKAEVGPRNSSSTE